MPRARRGMFKRGAVWYCRDFRGGGDRWIRLGDRFDAAVEEYDRIKRSRPAVGASRATVADIVAEWIRLEVAVRRRSDRAVAEAWSKARVHLVPFLGFLRIADLRPDHVAEYRAHLEAKRDASGRALKPSTVRHALTDLRRMLRWCVATGRLSALPWPPGIMPTVPKGEPRPFTDAEVKILTSLPDPLGFICRWGIESMLSWSDLCRSTAAMVDGNGILSAIRGKTGQISVVPVSSGLRAEIRVRIGLLVRYSANSKGSVTRDIRAASGIKGFSIHRLRHTGAMLRLRAGWTADEVRLMLGHASVTTTETYARVTRAMIEAKAARLEKARRA